MELRQLSYFVAVADEGGFARAAEKLHIGQPAVSQQVRRLERGLGVRLFDRSTRHVRLTGAGERLLPEARTVLAAAERTRALAARLASRTEVLNLGIGQLAGERLYPLLGRLAERAPELRVGLVRVGQDDRIAGVRSGALDAAVVRDPEPVPGLELMPLWTDPLVAALPTGILPGEADGGAEGATPGGGRISVRELGDLPVRLAGPKANPAFHRTVTAVFRDAGVDPPAGPPFTRLQETLADMTHTAPSWTLFYPLGPLPPIPGISYRFLSDASSTTRLAVRPGPPPSRVRHLLAVLPHI